MKLGITLRNMGPQSSAEWLREGARAADELGFESLWITDHVAIPPDDAEGSGGRYLDALVTLGVLAGVTRRIGLGTGVLILPYREPLATAKQVATLQELSGNRLLLGVGIGWMDAEFRVLGLDRGRRGRDADERLAFLHRCFDNELVEANGQPFLFKPRPPRPPLLIGGRAPHALERAVRYGDGWLPMGGDPQRLAADLETYVRIASAHGRERGSVTVMRPLPGEDPEACRALLAEYAELGVERVVAAIRYDTIEEYLTALERLASLLPS